VVSDGVIYIGSYDHKLYALDAVTGDILWTYTTGGGIAYSPTVANGMVYVGSNDGNIYAFKSSTSSPSSAVTIRTGMS
jgi:eukaryotic-like serine/threonine-protein kinase